MCFIVALSSRSTSWDRSTLFSFRTVHCLSSTDFQRTQRCVPKQFSSHFPFLSYCSNQSHVSIKLFSYFGRQPCDSQPVGFSFLSWESVLLSNTYHSLTPKEPWLERSVVKQEDLGSIPAETKCFSSLLVYDEIGIKWIQTQQIV